MAKANQRISLRRIAVGFNISDWYNNSMVVIPSGIPANPGEIGPHSMPPAAYLETSVYKNLSGSFIKEVGLTITFDKASGKIYIFKAALAPDFAGVVFVESY